MKIKDIITEAATPAQQAAIAINMQKHHKRPHDMSEESDSKCPPATQDITLNLKNRQKAINEYGYGPLNPDMPNQKFWMAKQDEWNLDSPDEAKSSLCGNCAAFDQRTDTLDCIAQGIGSDQGADDPTIDAGDLGYCRFLKFKCASRRTCDAWVTGGPLRDKESEAQEPLAEKWSQKYKSSINCSHPKGFSQRAHCAGKRKHNESVEMEQVCPDCGMCQTHGNLNEIKKGQKDSNGYTRCWPGKHAEGTKKGKNGGQVRNCVPNESVEEGEVVPFRRSPTQTAWQKITPDVLQLANDWFWANEDSNGLQAVMDPNGLGNGIDNDLKYIQAKLQTKGWTIDFDDEIDNIVLTNRSGQTVALPVADAYDETGWAKGTLSEEFDLIESAIENLANRNAVDAEVIWEDLESLTDDELYVFAVTQEPIMETEAWQKANKKDKTDGMSRKAVKTYRREHPGSKLQTAVTTKPSKLKKGSKASKRRKSYCSRSKGQMKMHNISCAKTPDKAICKARRRWNC